MPKDANASPQRWRASNPLVLAAHDLSYKKRLHHSWEYRNFFNQSEVFRLSECTVFRIPNSVGHFRLGITLKARGSSLERNRVKRQIREAFRTQQASLGNYDYNIVIPGHKKMSYPYPEKLGLCLRERLTDAIKSK